MPDATEPASRRRARRRSLRQLLALIAAGPLLVLLASVVAGIIALNHSDSVRVALLDRVEPAEVAALRLTTAMVNQETGIRGYELTGRTQFLQPYQLGREQQMAEIALLESKHLPGLAGPLATALSRIDAWETDTASPALRAGSRSSAGVGGTRLDASLSGKHGFDAIRAALGALQSAVHARVIAARGQLATAARTTEITLATIAVVLLLGVLAAAVAVQRLITSPILRLSAATRQVAGGDLAHQVRISAPSDVERLGEDVESMRLRLVRELDLANEARAELAASAAELERSNAELEQFAYVASHDLQEPLRKVIGFGRLLQERYAGKLDAQADRYIEFARDGAERMQQLIDDLLEFSRVGRMAPGRAPVNLAELAASALADLQEPVRTSGARVTIGELPTLAVEPALMRAVLQNLLSNAIKFRRDEPPEVRLDATRLDGEWVLSCTDNGIGIQPEDAERIFVIFQRLHAREDLPGTGIGLALCRKIVDYHGGRIWLDTSHRPGARICLALPAEAAEPPRGEPEAGQRSVSTLSGTDI